MVKCRKAGTARLFRAFLVFAGCMQLPNMNCGLFRNEIPSLTIGRRPYTGSELRMNGYYWAEYTGSLLIYVFYRNGIVLHGGDIDPNMLTQTEGWFKDGTYYEWARKDQIDWGVFQIDSNHIEFETWYPSDAGNSLITRTNSGEILNDTTFHISKAWESDGDVYNNIDITYHFKQFSPKPDSTCPFIP